MPFDDLSKSLVVLDQDSTLISVIELSLSSWLVAGLVPGLDRRPQKKLEPKPEALHSLLLRWRDEAIKAGHPISRIVVAFEAGRDGFWLARFLRARGIEAYVIHASSVPVKREHRRAKSDRLDNLLLMRGLLGWLRGEEGHCSMVAVPTLEEEDAKRPSREHESLVGQRTSLINHMKASLIRFGIRNFNPALRKAAERLDGLRTAEGTPLPPQHAGGTAPRHGAALPRQGADQGDRDATAGPPRSGAAARPASDDAVARQGARPRHRDGGHAGQ